MKIAKLVRQNKGNAIPLACVIIIALIMISSVVFESIRLAVISNGIRDALQSAVISVATGNYDEIYNSLREGYSGGYIKGNSGWQEKMDRGNIYDELDAILGLESEHTKMTGSEKEFTLSGLEVNMLNVSFAPLNPDVIAKFTVEAKIQAKIPLSYGWDMLPPIYLNIRTTAGYVPKF